MTSGRRIAAAAAVLVASGPLALVGTFLLGSLWKWVETAHGIESWGHSGPALWCYGATYVACVVLLTVIVLVVTGVRGEKVA